MPPATNRFDKEKNDTNRLICVIVLASTDAHAERSSDRVQPHTPAVAIPQQLPEQQVGDRYRFRQGSSATLRKQLAHPRAVREMSPAYGCVHATPTPHAQNTIHHHNIVFQRTCTQLPRHRLSRPGTKQKLTQHELDNFCLTR